MRFSEACIGEQNGTEQRIGARVRRSRQKEARGAVLAKELGAPTDMVEPLCGLWTPKDRFVKVQAAIV